MQQLIHTCTISRNTPVGTNGRRQLQLLAEGVPCLALPMSAQATIQNGFDLGRAYNFYFQPGTDVNVKDKLIWEGDSYTVSGKQVFDVPVVGHVLCWAQQEIGS